MRRLNLDTSRVIVAAAVACACSLAACRSPEGEPPLFVKLSEAQTGLDFANSLAEDTTFNILNYLYYYNGGGVAVGDVNGDGLLDVYLTGNEVPNRLYLNRGDMRFEDLTEAAGVAGDADWTTGAVMADVNGDGLIDIYVSVVGGYLDRRGRNQLFMNNGDGTFTDRAPEMGLDFEGYATHASFFDYDLDGDLDVYLLNHSTHYEGTYGPASIRERPHDRAGDRLLRNDGDRFVDVTAEAGIYSSAVGYGLTVVTVDLSQDGWPDIYVGNDFHENDYLYLNNGDGTFTETIREAMGHTSRFSMGVDVADINNDGLPDLVVLDMLPEKEEILKTSDGAESYDLYNLKVDLGYHHQATRNTLQLNRGAMRFSDIALLAGVQATDWSWAPLLADFDNDGWRDLFVTNGIYRRPNDLDYINFISNEAIRESLEQGITQQNITLLERMPQVRIPNYLYRNNGDLTFTNVADTWGVGDEAYSNGAVYADLDNDGDLDLIVNNVNEPVAVYENRARQTGDNAFLTIALQGDGANTFGVGAKVAIVAGGTRQVAEQTLTRGFQSSVDYRLHFGLGPVETVDSLMVVWPDRRVQVLRNVPANQMLVLHQRDAGHAGEAVELTPPPAGGPIFVNVTDAFPIDFRHEENVFVDFNRERLMPHKVSTEGPALAVGDVNGDGLDDFYVGGAKWRAGALFLQRVDGQFERWSEPTWSADSLYEDVDAAFFDADGDGDLDLFVVSAGNEFWGQAEALRDRLYINDGSGNFARDRAALPDYFAHGATVVPADFDGDGDIDLFVGSRVVAREYGVDPPSFILENDGTGVFNDVTVARAPGLLETGMVTAAAWLDFDGDGTLDLAVAGEWIPIRIFRQDEGRFEEVTEAVGLQATTGWWRSLEAADLDGDGHVDLVAGNLGLNSKIKAGPDRPAQLYLKDFDGNGSLDHVLTYYKRGTSYPVAGRDALIQQIEPLKKKYLAYADFGASRITEIFSRSDLRDVAVKEARTFATSFARNNGDGTFTIAPLPVEAQFAPVYAISVGDFDGDGMADVLLAGNFFGADPSRGRYDASHGLLVRFEGERAEAVDPSVSNLYLSGEVRAVRPLRHASGKTLLLVARNDAPLAVLRACTDPPGGGP